MRMVFCIFLTMQHLFYQEAVSCPYRKYEVNGECCPRCRAGWRVSKDCTSRSTTRCVPCSKGTYTDHANALTKCLKCQVCNSGAHLKVKEECTRMKNTVCSCKPGYFCSRLTNEQSCEKCTKHTVSPPGYKVIQAGTERNDTIFVPCPPGTFSTTEMSFSCRPWTNCSKKGLIEIWPGHASLDAICRHIDSVVSIVTTLVLAVLYAVLIIIFIWRRENTP